jgi:HEAT repeat protein
MAVSLHNWEALRQLPVQELILDWEKFTSLAPGGFWASYLLSSLYTIGRPAIAPLMIHAQDRHMSLNSRSLALHTLGLLDSKDSNQQIMKLYQNEANKDVKLAVIHSFRLQGKTAIPFLIDMFSTEGMDEEICASLAWALASQGSFAVNKLTPCLQSTHRLIRHYAGLALLATADPQALFQVKSSDDSNPNGHLKTLSQQFLRQIETESSLTDKNRNQTSPVPVFKPKRLLVHFSQKKERELFILSLLFLGNIQNKESADSLFQTATNTPDDTIKIEALLSSSQLLPSEEALHSLHNGLQHGDNLIRYWSCIGLMRKRYQVIGLF